MATINLTPTISLTRTSGEPAVRFDKPGDLRLTSDQARDLLTKIRAEITAGGTVQTGYLSLQRANDGQFTIENRSRFNPSGSKDIAAELVKNLIRIAYGDAIGAQSSAALESAIDDYLADKNFGKQLGTVSFVRLINALEVNVHTEGTEKTPKGTATADKKSSLESLLGAGGSLAIDAQGIAAGASAARVDTLRPPGQQTGLRGVTELQAQIKGLQALRSELPQGQDSPVLAATLGKLDAALAQARIELGFAERMVGLATATQPLIAQGTDTADRISDATTQIRAHVALEQALKDNTEGLEHPGLASSIAQLATQRAELSGRLNTDILARVDTLRPPGKEGQVGTLGGAGAVAALRDQIQGLQTLQEQLPQGPDSPILPATRNKVDAALSQAEEELAARQASNLTQAGLREQGPVKAFATRVATLDKDLQTSNDYADHIAAAATQYQAHTALRQEMARYNDGLDNAGLNQSMTQLGTRRAALADKLNTDISARVDTLRPPGKEGQVGTLGGAGAVAALRDQIQGLQTLQEQLPQGPDTPILPATRNKVDAALSQAEGELAARQASNLTQAGLREQGPVKAFATRVATLDKDLQTSNDYADHIVAATTQYQADSALQKEMARYNDGLNNAGLNQSMTQLGTRQSALADKLNADILARVVTLRPPVQDTSVADAPSLSIQVNSLRAIKTAINAGQADAQEPVTPATRQKVDEALAAAETALEAATAGDQPEAVSAKGLIKETLDRLGLRADTASARATSRLGEHDIPWALREHQALGKGIDALKTAIEAMADKPAGQAELAGLQARLSQTQDKLAERINADITLIVADCKTSATAAAAGRDSEAVLRAGASLAQLHAFIQPAASDQAQPAQGVPCVSERTAAAVAQALDDVMAAAVGAIETGDMQARLDKLAGTPQGGLAGQASRAQALNDLLQGMTLLATFVPAGAQADDLASLRTKTAWQAHDTLVTLKTALESTQPGGASDGAQASDQASAQARVRGQALADFDSQVKRLLNLTQGTPALSGVLGEVHNLQAALPELTLKEARSLLLNWSSSGDPSKSIDPRVQQSIDRSSNKKALDADIVALYQRGLFHAGDAFMGRLSGVLAQGGTGSLKWLTELAAGEPAAVNGLLNEPQWDDIALRLKKSAPAAQTPQAQAKIELDHARHIALRTLDNLLRQANPTWGTGGQPSFNALNLQGMQSLRFDEPTVTALLKAGGIDRRASDPQAPTLNIESMQLMLASLIAMEAPQGDPLDAGQRAEQDRAKSLLLQLPFIQASGLNANTPATQVLAKALEWSSGTQTTPEALLKAADRIRGASNKLAGDAQQLLAGLKAFEQNRDPIKAKADDQYLRLKAHLFGLNRSSDVVRQAELETHDALFNRLAIPLQSGMRSADKVNTFLDGIGQASGLEFQAAVDLSEVRGMAAQVVSETPTGRIQVREGIVEHYFGVTSKALRKGDADTDVRVRIRNNLASQPLGTHLAANPRLESATALRFEGLAAAVGRGPASAAIKAGMPGLGADLAAWQAFLDPPNKPNPHPHAPYKQPGTLGQVALGVGLASEETKARDYLNDLWGDLEKAVGEASKARTQPDAPTIANLRVLAERYVALVEIGERHGDIQKAITGLKAGLTLRTQAEAAVQQVGEVNPEAQRVAMTVMLGLFRSTGLSDLNAFRAELLAPGAEGGTSSLEAQLSGRLREMNLEMISGKPMVAFCKALLVSQENANALLDDKLDGWTGQIKEAIASKLGISLVPAAPKAVATYLAQQELSTALNDRIKTLLPGQSFELRASESGEIEVTIPTTLPGVDATAGFSLGRDNGVLVRMEADNRYSVVCKQGTEAGASGGISVLGGAIKARAGLSAQVGGGFCIEYDTLSKTQAFVRALFDTPSPSQAAELMDAAARTRVLDSTGVTAGVEASAETEVQLTPGDMDLALGLQMRADASASVSRQQAVERSGVQTMVSTRFSYAWAASAESKVEGLADADKIGGDARNVASAELLRRGHENLAASVAPSELPESAPLDGAGDEAESAETEEAEMTSVMSAKLAASTAREEFDEQRIVTRRGAIHASSSLVKGFRDQPATATATGAGTVYREKLLEQRIGTLLAGTKFEGQLTGGSAFASRLQALLSIAGNGPYEIAVEFTLKEQVALQLADLPRKGAADTARALLGDPRSYEPAKLTLTVAQTSEVNSSRTLSELNIPGLQDLAPTATYRKTALAERSTVVTLDLAAMARPGAGDLGMLRD